MISVLFILCFSTGILLNDVEKDRIEIVVVLLKCCRTPLVLQISPQLPSIIPISVKEMQSRIFFCRILAKFEDLCLVHVLQQPLRCFTEPVDLLRLTHILKKLFFVLM